MCRAGFPFFARIFIGFALPWARVDKFWIVIITIFFIHENIETILQTWHGKNPNTVVQAYIVVEFKSILCTLLSVA